MTSFTYLKDLQCYIERYDLHTIEECLRWYWDMKDSFEKHRGNEEFKDDTMKEFDEEVKKVLHRLLLAIKTQRYQNKNKTQF